MVIALDSSFYFYDLKTDNVVFEYCNDSAIKGICNKMEVDYENTDINSYYI